MRLVRSASVHVNGVSVKHEICAVMEQLDQLHQTYTGKDAEFTSIVDGTHSRGSLHYVGLAVDMRIWHLGALLREFEKEAKALLGPDYDVVLEPTHLHVEFQPKAPR